MELARARPSSAIACVVAVLVIAACSSSDGCVEAVPFGGPCADLLFQGRSYDEWRAVEPSGILQEVGNATYPSCNAAEVCDRADLDGFGATDVWLLDDVETTDAVIGLREGTHTYVIFVRVGVDPEGLQ